MAWRLAQINVAKFKAPADDPANLDFVRMIDSVNAQAEIQPGFVWRMDGDGGPANAADVAAYEADNMIVNLSVWTDPDALRAFAWNDPMHRGMWMRKRQWFERMKVYLALWWIPEGERPTVAEGRARLAHLAEHGPGPYVFTFGAPQPAPES